MSIQAAVQKSSSIQIYGENGSILGSIPTNCNDRLLGYTSETVTVQKGDFVNIYSESGILLSSIPA